MLQTAPDSLFELFPDNCQEPSRHSSCASTLNILLKHMHAWRCASSHHLDSHVDTFPSGELRSFLPHASPYRNSVLLWRVGSVLEETGHFDIGPSWVWLPHSETGCEAALQHSTLVSYLWSLNTKQQVMASVEHKEMKDAHSWAHFPHFHTVHNQIQGLELPQKVDEG